MGQSRICVWTREKRRRSVLHKDMQVGKRKLPAPQVIQGMLGLHKKQITESQKLKEHRTTSYLVILQYFAVSSHCTWTFASIIGKITFIAAAYSSLAARARHSWAGSRYDCSARSMGVGRSVPRPMYLTWEARTKVSLKKKNVQTHPNYFFVTYLYMDRGVHVCYLTHWNFFSLDSRSHEQKSTSVFFTVNAVYQQNIFAAWLHFCC